MKVRYNSLRQVTFHPPATIFIRTCIIFRFFSILLLPELWHVLGRLLFFSLFFFFFWCWYRFCLFSPFSSPGRPSKNRKEKGFEGRDKKKKKEKRERQHPRCIPSSPPLLLSLFSLYFSNIHQSLWRTSSNSSTFPANLRPVLTDWKISISSFLDTTLPWLKVASIPLTPSRLALRHHRSITA